MEIAMNKLILALIGTFFCASMALAQTAASPTAGARGANCEAKAIDKNGKPLAGAAKTSFMKKCDASAPAADKSSACAAKAVDKNGKPLAGAAKSSFMKKCEA
jgi:hypothetical protein